MRPVKFVLTALVKRICRHGRPPSKIETFHPERIGNILIVSSTGLGDTLLSTPAIRSIRKRYPGARITLHVRKRYQELFQSNKNIDAVIPYFGGYKRFLSTVRAFRKENFDLGVILHGNGPQAIPMAYLSGAPYVVRLPLCKDFGFLLSNKESEGDDYRNQHTIMARLKIASLIGCVDTSPEMELEVDQEDRDYVDQWLNQVGIDHASTLIGLQVGAARPYKQWPPERFGELARRIIDFDPHANILILGSGKEKSLCLLVKRLIGSDRAFSLAGSLSLRQVAALVERINLLITNDTGIMHMAIALRTKTISLFCPTHSWAVGPIQDRDLHTVIEKEPPCPECLTKKCEHPFCMNEISVDEVFSEIRKSLAQWPTGADRQVLPDRLQD
jgi:ADP-heptose:LPS heptosyltransferase